MNKLLFELPFTFGLVYVIVGIILMIYPPKNRNFFLGYRTSASLRSQAHWDFAQQYSSKMLIRIGCILLGFSFCSLTINISELSSNIIAFFVVGFSTFFIFQHTERQLKRL